MWEALKYIGTGLSLVGFIAAVASFAYRQRLNQKADIIKSAPSADRLEAIAAASEFFRIDTSRLTPSQQKEIVLEQIRSRAQRDRMIGLVSLLIAFLFAGLAAIAILEGPDQKKPDPTPTPSPLFQPSPPPSSSPAPVTVPSQVALSGEQQLWASANSCAEWGEYLRRYPAGEFAVSARNRRSANQCGDDFPRDALSCTTGDMINLVYRRTEVGQWVEEDGNTGVIRYRFTVDHSASGKVTLYDANRDDWLRLNIYENTVEYRGDAQNQFFILCRFK